jgi:LacI family transcriptional regulator
MKRSVTQASIAKYVGVSQATVAWALNAKRRSRISAETCEKIDNAIIKLGYRPNRYAQFMRNGKSDLIGILRAGTYNPLRDNLEFHTTQNILNNGYRPNIRTADTNQTIQDICNDFLDDRIEGLLIEGPFQHTGFVVDFFVKASIPTAVISGFEVPRTIHIRPDLKKGMEDIVEHLIKLGRHKIALVLKWLDPKSVGWWIRKERLLGFLKIIKKYEGTAIENSGHIEKIVKIDRDIKLFKGRSKISGEIFFTHSTPNKLDPYEEGLKVANGLIDRLKTKDALICANDDWALAAMSACKQHSIKVPQDLAITGWDNVPAAAYFHVPLTTIDTPNTEIAKIAVTELCKQIKEGKNRRRKGIIRLPTKLIIRESCGELL